jgi:hypothetical protein
MSALQITWVINAICAFVVLQVCRAKNQILSAASVLKISIGIVNFLRKFTSQIRNFRKTLSCNMDHPRLLATCWSSSAY